MRDINITDDINYIDIGNLTLHSSSSNSSLKQKS
jgi:hypothetical protein